MHRLFQNKNLTVHLALFFLLCISIFATNFPFHGFLTGWDNLHPEFNFPLNFSRAINSVWQENQGLGTYGGHGYAATLPHTLFLYLFSFVISVMYLRSFFTFLCLFTGGLGVFYLVRKILGKNHEGLRNSAALLSAIFYMLNFGTVQNFYIQLESFIVHFALLPWLFLTCIYFLERPTKKTFAVFTVVSIAATVQGFIPPLFFVYMMLLCIFLFFYLIKKISVRKFKLAFIVFGTTLVVNAYWFLPVILYSLTRSNTYLNAYINLSSTEDFILKNEMFGKIQDLAILRGFISKAIDSQNGQVFLIFSQWNKHFSNLSIQIAGYVLFGFILFGALLFAVKREIEYRWFFFVGFLITFSLLATDTFPFSYATRLMQEIPILKQAFRVAFTKFSISVSFFYAISLGISIYGLLLATSRISMRSLRIAAMGGLVVSVSTLIIYFTWPVFTGNFLYSRTKITVPSMYFDMFSFFDKQDKDARIMNLPQGWAWGWSVYNWGYSGSGFLWYGIEQPIMDRSFDSWGKSNENYYWELNHAIYAEDFHQFQNILNKYNISWIVLDKNIVPYLDARGSLYSSLFEKYLDTSNSVKLDKTLKAAQGSGLQDIKIYQVKNAPKTSQTVISLASVKNIEPDYNYSDSDQAFSDFGTYISSPSSPTDTYYPFRSLFSNTRMNQESLAKSNLTVMKNPDTIRIGSKYPSSIQAYNFMLPPFSDLTKQLNPIIETANNKLSITTGIPKDSYYTYISGKDPNLLHHAPSNCQEKPSKPDAVYLQDTQEGTIRLTSINSENCFSISLPNLPQRNGYLAIITSKHMEGKPLQFAVINNESKKADIVYSLTDKNNFDTDYVFIPPMKFYGLGYNLFFNNISIGDKKTVNEIQSVELFPIPYDLLKGVHFVSNTANPVSGTLITNDQAFDPGWKAYVVNVKCQMSNVKCSIAESFPFWFGTELKDHVLVNSWANGWTVLQDPRSKIQDPRSIIIIFLPQYLEYAGFILLGSSILVLSVISLKSYLKRRKTHTDTPFSS